MCIHICVYIHIYTYVCMYTYTCVCIYICIYACVCIYMGVSMLLVSSVFLIKGGTGVLFALYTSYIGLTKVPRSIPRPLFGQETK